MGVSDLERVDRGILEVTVEVRLEAPWEPGRSSRGIARGLSQRSGQELVDWCRRENDCKKKHKQK